MNEYGMRTKNSPGRELFSEFNGKKYARYPVVTPLVEIGGNDSLNQFIEKYALPYLKQGDILCVSAKVVSIAKGYVLHESKVKVTLLAKFIVKFVTKWPDDIGYSHPRKMQAAINIVGYPRIILAIIVGSILKVLGFRGWFYKIAGHNINAIDGFNPVSIPPMNEYAVLPPPNSDAICNDYEEKFKTPVIILDGNNIDNNILGMGKKAKNMFSKTDLMQILKGNPQGQEDDGIRSPILIVREIK